MPPFSTFCHFVTVRHDTKGLVAGQPPLDFMRLTSTGHRALTYNRLFPTLFKDHKLLIDCLFRYSLHWERERQEATVLTAFVSKTRVGHILSASETAQKENLMLRRSSPEVGCWYEDAELGRVFEVVSLDEGENAVAIQYFEGEIEALEVDAFMQMPLRIVDQPE